MKIALLGYGKMGKEVERIAFERGHKIILSVNSKRDVNGKILKKSDVAIEFSTPDSAYGNILKCFNVNVPVVCGTTGWLSKYDDICRICIEKKQTFFYSSNFSIGMNIVFEANKRIAGMMNGQKHYHIIIKEVHHKQKKDMPGGTAIKIAGDIIEQIKWKKNWILNKTGNSETIPVFAERTGEVAGVHCVTYESEYDIIELRHEAKNRKGFALGAVMAAEWIIGKKGVYNMKHLLKI